MPMQIIGSGTRMDDVTIAKVTSGGYLWVAGSISSMPAIGVTPTGSQEVFTSTGSVEMYGTIATTPGSESVITAGSVQTYDPIGIGSVHLVPGSLEVYQTTASDMQISGIVTVSGIFHDVLGSVSVQQDTIPWITSGTATVSGLFHDVIGSVYVSQIVPGVAATNLGKAEDAAHTTGDVGVLALAVRKDGVAEALSDDGDYTPLQVNEDGILKAESQQHLHIDECEATVGWSVLGNDTGSFATTTNHTWGANALEFDKADSGDDTVFAGIQKTLSSVDFNAYEKGGGFFLWNLYISTIADIDYAFLRLGTDSSNYNEFRVAGTDLSIGWNPIRMPVFHPSSVVGNGWDSSDIDYVVVGVAFDDEADTLTDIAVDHISINTGLQTSSDITAQISSDVSSPNVIVRAWGNAVDTNAGNVSANTLRTVLATNQARLAGSIVNMPIVGISGTIIGISGVVNQGTTPWTVSGTSTISGVISNRVGGSIVNWPGSLAVSNFAALGSSVVVTNFGTLGSSRVVEAGAIPVETEQTRGVFVTSGATIHTSGTAKVVISPGTGSKLLLKGFTSSAELATKFRLIFSGGTPTHIGAWNLPNSGTVAMNMLGMEPSGATNQSLAFGLFNNGSIHVTVFARNTL